MNVAGARIAREAAGDRFVAGSVGPLNVTLSLSPKVDDPSLPHAHLRPGQGGLRRADRGARRGRRRPAPARDDLRHAEREGGDRRPRARPRPSVPLWISATIVDLSGRTLSGQTIEAFWVSVEHAEPLIVGDQLLARREGDAAVRRRARARSRRASSRAHPNAGLPNAFGGYDETPEVTSALLRRVRARRASSTSPAAAAARRPSTRARSPPRSAASRRARSPSRARAAALERARAVRDRPRHRASC